MVALVSMTLDHVSKILFDSKDCFGTEFGRVAMPLFVFLLCYNFLYHSKNYNLYLKRIFLFAILSQAPYYFAFHQSVLLNILFTLGFLGLVLAFSLKFLQKSVWNYYIILTALIVFFVALRWLQIPFYFEYGIAGVVLGLSITAFLQFKTIEFGLYCLISCYFLNLSLNSFLALLFYLPIILIVSRWIPLDFSWVQKQKYLFYAYYPIHLCLITGISWWIG